MYNFLLRNTAFGIWAGVTIAMLIAFIFDSSLVPEAKRNFKFLVTAVVSMMSAGLALGGVFLSIQNQQNLDNKARANKLASARAFLPTSLSRMTEICRLGVDYSHNFSAHEKALGRTEFGHQSIEKLELSDEIISVFRDVIELTEDGKVRNRLAGIVREHQVFHSRWKSNFEDGWQYMVEIDSDIRQRTKAWAYLCALVNSLYDFARRETEEPLDVTSESISSALGTLSAIDVFPENFTEEIGLYARTFKRRFE